MDSVVQINPSWLVILMAVVAIVPMALSLLTSYLKMSIVFGMVKNALGTQSSPSAITVMALSAALTCFTMGPVFEECVRAGASLDMQGLLQSPSEQKLAVMAEIFSPWRRFLEKHSGVRELKTLEGLQQTEPAAALGGDTRAGSISTLKMLVPAFVLTELKEGFSMGFVLLLPFLVVDLIVANILVGLGMSMVSPVMIALPIKLLLFVASDGWLLLAKGLVLSYQ